MEIGQIEAFVRVVREGSFTKAAQAMNLTQPTISSRISVLEAELGCQLFVRGGRRLSLTPVGEALWPHAERTLMELHDGEQAVMEYKTGRRGYVSIVALDTLAMSFLPKPVQRFRREYPEVDLTVHLNMPRGILEMIYENKTQLGLIRGPLWDRSIDIIARFQEPVQVITNAAHPLAQQDRISLQDVLNFPIYRVPLDAATVAFVEHLVEQARTQNNQSQVWLPVIMVIPMLMEGQGVAFLPESLVSEYVNNGELVALEIADLPFLKHEPLLVKLNDCRLNTHHQDLVRMIRAQWRQIEVGG
jgi:DNA-binding transcriptional LysR family regulator